MKYVFHALRMQWRCATQYRASFWMQTLAQLVMSGSELMAVLVLLGRFTSVGQWSGSEIMFFFGMMQMTFAITECVGRGLTAFSRVVQGGEFDQILLRPRNLLLQVLCSSTDPRRLSTAVLGIVLMWFSVTQLGIPWTLGSTVLLLISVAGTVLMLLGLFLVEAPDSAAVHVCRAVWAVYARSGECAAASPDGGLACVDGVPCAAGRSSVLWADGAGVAEGRGQAVLLDGVVRAGKFGAAFRSSSLIAKAPPHNSAARLSMSFPPSAACKFLDLPPVNLRNLHLHLTKNPFASRPPHLCGVTLILFALSSISRLYWLLFCVK